MRLTLLSQVVVQAKVLALLVTHSQVYFCGHVVDPTDAYQFTQVNNGNCIAMPFAKAGVGVLSLTYNMCLKNCSLKNGAAVILKKEQFLNREMLKFLTKLKRLLTEIFLIFFLTLIKNLLRVLLQVSNSKTCSSLTASAIRLPNTLRQSLINFALKQVCNAYLFLFADFILPPLRHFVTPLLKERLSKGLPSRGAVNAVDCGVAPLFFGYLAQRATNGRPHIFFILSKIIHI